MKWLSIKNNNSQQRGFSLVEVIVAIYILTSGILGVMVLIDSVTRAGAVGSPKLIAVNLAQEGIEVVKNIRDLNDDLVTGTGWGNWFSSIVSGDYLVQCDDTSLRPFSDTVLNYDSTTGLYGYDAGQATAFSFKRKITMTKISDAEIRVFSTVSWIEKGQNKSLVVEDHLWNWR